MIHIEIFSYILTLMAGVGAMVMAWQTSRNYPYNFLKPFFVFLVFTNALVLLSLITQYCCANLYGNCMLFKGTLARDTIHPLGHLFLLGRTVAFLWLALAFHDVGISKSLRRIVLTGLSVLGLTYLIRSFWPKTGLVASGLIPLHNIIYPVMVCGFYTMLLIFMLSALHIKEKPRRRMMLTLGLCYFIGHSVMVAVHWFPYPFKLTFILPMLLLFNVFPFYWFKSPFAAFHQSRLSTIQGDPAVEAILKKHHISKREREIIDLILKGKSNKEIEAMLYISLSTVKNHIYTLYQKLGINSRTQLVHLILESQRKSE